MVVKQTLDQGETPTTIRPKDIKSASWSSDGSQIVFTKANAAGGYDLMISAADGTELVRLDWPGDHGKPWSTAWGPR